jgi:MFS family permease
LRSSTGLPLVGGVVAAVALVSFMRVPLLPDIARDLELSTGAVAMITAGFAVGRLIMDLPAGRLADRLPPLLALAATGVGITLGALVLATAGSLGQAVAGAGLLGLISAQTNTTAMKAFATRASAGSRARSMAGFSTSLMTGQTLGPAAGGALGGLLGWRASQAGGAAVGVAVALVCWAAARRAAVARAMPADDADAAARADAARAAAERDRLAPGLSRRDIVVLAGVPFAVFFTLAGVLQTLAPLIAADELGLGPSVIGIAIGLGGLTRAVGAFAAGRLADGVSRKAALVPARLLMAGGAALLIPDPTLITWIGAVVVLSFASSGIPLAATMIADRVPAGTLGRRLGSYRFMGDAGLLAGPAVGGLVAQHAGRGAAMALTATLLLASAASLRMVAEVTPQQRA